MLLEKDLVAASAAPMVLAILSRGESYGYAILKAIRQRSQGEIQWTDGMLYPVLHRLEKQGLIESRWGESETGRKRRYYRIKKAGGAALKDHLRQWMTVYSTLTQLGKEQPCLT